MEDFKQYQTRITEFIRRLRVERNISQKQLSETVGVSTQTISNFESGRSSINLNTLLSIFIALGRKDLLDSLFPLEYTSPILEMKKSKLARSLIKMRSHPNRGSSAKGRSDSLSSKRDNSEKQIKSPFESVLANKNKNKN